MNKDCCENCKNSCGSDQLTCTKNGGENVEKDSYCFEYEKKAKNRQNAQIQKL